MVTLYAIQPRDQTTHSAGQSDFPGLPIQPQLRDVNRCLQFLELPLLTASAMQALLSQQPRDRVLRAIRLAGRGDAGSLAFLRHRITAICQSPAAPRQPIPLSSTTAAARTPPVEQDGIAAAAANPSAMLASVGEAACTDRDPPASLTLRDSFGTGFRKQFLEKQAVEQNGTLGTKKIRHLIFFLLRVYLVNCLYHHLFH